MYIHFPEMDISYERNGQTFTWNADKAAANLRKHGVSFEKACERKTYEHE